jgi:hypothetical protein
MFADHDMKAYYYERVAGHAADASLAHLARRCPADEAL